MLDWMRVNDPDLNKNATNYRDNHQHIDAMEIILHFINVKYWNMLTNRNGNKPARVMVAYLWEEMWQLHASKLCYNEAQGNFYYLKTKGNPKQTNP